MGCRSLSRISIRSMQPSSARMPCSQTRHGGGWGREFIGVDCLHQVESTRCMLGLQQHQQQQLTM